jgi:integrase
MARTKITWDRVLGPYQRRDGWIVRYRWADGRRDDFFFTSEAKARAEANALRVKLGLQVDRTVGMALAEYERFRRDKGNKPDSVKQTSKRLNRFFLDHEMPLTRLTERAAEGYYRRFVDAGLAADTHRNYLAEAKSFLAWAYDRGFAHENALRRVKGVGKRQHGKPQLRIDEARKWVAKATELADRGDDAAVAAMLSLVLGMRASEIVTRVARDIDDEGTLLWISASKTEAGRRTLQIPLLLQPYLRRLTEGRAPNDYLFPDLWNDHRGVPRPRKNRARFKTGHRYRDWVRDAVRRICGLAGVTIVTAHGMRGLHSSLAVEAGVTSHVVAAAIGHESFSTTAESYATQDALDAAKQRRTMKVLSGGKP